MSEDLNVRKDALKEELKALIEEQIAADHYKPRTEIEWQSFIRSVIYPKEVY